MPDDDGDGLRIGRWVPTYDDVDAVRPPAPDVPGRRVRALPAGLRQRRPEPPATAPDGGFRPAGGPLHRRRALLAAGTGALIAAAGLVAVAVSGDEPERAEPARQVAVPAFAPSDPVSVRPSPTTASPSAAPASVPATRTRPAGPTSRAATTAPSSRPPRTTPPAAAVSLAVGSTVGLELHGGAGLRLRHRDFRARVDAVGADSSRLDRFDARFTVRAGLADGRCVTFESVNYPGRFLRHRDYVLHLDRRDRSVLFARDATFCPRPVHRGAALVLESVNYPGFFLVAGDGGVRIERVAAQDATAFVPRPPV